MRLIKKSGRTALNNGKVFISGKLKKTNILIQGNKISRISEKKIGAENEIDCAGKVILPGAIDVHVHFRSPGFEYKEDWKSGSEAALSGGVTTVMDMPNTKPQTVTLNDFLEKKKLASENSLVNFDIYMAATGDNLSEIAKVKKLRGVKVYFGSSTGNMLFNDEKKLKELFVLAKKKGFVVVCHAEDEEEIMKNTEKFNGKTEPAIHSEIRTAEAERIAIKKLAELQSRIGNKLHIAHVSSRKGLEEIRKAKKGRYGKHITCEVTPHHLFLDSLDYKKLGNLMKCNPSIKSASDREELWKGLKSGLIDIVATDHAPHSLEEKKKAYWDSPSGIPGVETSFPLLLNEANQKNISMGRVMEAMSEKPAEIFSWKRKGKIKKGFDADLVIVDMEKERKIRDSEMITKAKYSVFNGKTIKGFIEKTIIGGNIYG